ncbi:hypothetical protein ABZ591_27080 [Micromonospora fulviviridis]|uniref:hypothetical protein n=1 Tax=Micromonospora fulviviridis TaxID=47860 RepID=UPI0033DF4649
MVALGDVVLLLVSAGLSAPVAVLGVVALTVAVTPVTPMRRPAPRRPPGSRPVPGGIIVG